MQMTFSVGLKMLKFQINSFHNQGFIGQKTCRLKTMVVIFKQDFSKFDSRNPRNLIVLTVSQSLSAIRLHIRSVMQRGWGRGGGGYMHLLVPCMG